jgi:hypothetical protein
MSISPLLGRNTFLNMLQRFNMKLSRSSVNVLRATCLGALVCASSVNADVFVGVSGTGSTANQLVHAPGGVGHILLTPYFTAQGGNATILSITNNDPSNGKAVKIRFRGAGNGDSLLSITVLLGPADVWTATVRQGGSGLAELVTTDTTCTVPRMSPGFAQTFLTGRLNPAWSDARKAANTREGYVEIQNMADVFLGGQNTALFDTMRGPSPACDDTVIRQAIVDVNHTSESTATAWGLTTPYGQLGGKWTIINVPQTTTFSGSMHAIRAVDANGMNAKANFVLFPQTDAPYGGSISGVTSDPLLRPVAYGVKFATGATSSPTASPAIAAANHDLPDLSTPFTVAPGGDAALTQAARVSAAIAARVISNEYASDSSISAKTDWTFSLPARRYSAAVSYGSPGSRLLFSLVPATGNQYFHDRNAVILASDTDRFCTPFNAQQFYGRDARIISQPPPPGRPFETPRSICGAVGVLSFSDANGASALSASVARDNYDALESGWVYFSGFDNGSGLNLPILGSSFIKATNPAVSPGISGTYGISYDHWLQR